MKNWLLTISILFFASALYSQNEGVPLRVRKNLRDRLDDLVYDFQLYSRMSTNEEKAQFRGLFDDTALVFDYITPNYLTRNIGQELNKPIDQFISDVGIDFPKGFIQSTLVDTNLGAAVDYATMDWSSPTVNVQVAFIVVGEYADGGQFSNTPVLDLTVRFDTLDQQVINFRISALTKISSELRYQKEERAPQFEKQIFSHGFNSWNVPTVEEKNGDYFIDNLKAVADKSYAFSFHLIKIISAPEPEEFSYTIGLGYKVSNYQLEMDNYFYSYLTTDRENDAVYRNVAGRELVESVTSEMIELPITFRYERKLNRFFSFYANMGLSLTYLLRSSYNGSAVFSYTGYYPKYNLLVTDVADYGFVSDQPEAQVFDSRISSFAKDHLGLGGLADLGINIEAKNGLVFYFGGFAFKGIVEPSRIVNFQLISTQEGEFNGLLPAVNSINFGGYGVQFGIRKRFRSRNGLVKMEQVINGQ